MVEPHGAVTIPGADADARVRKYGHTRLGVEAETSEPGVRHLSVEEASVLDGQPRSRQSDQPVRLDASAREEEDPFVEAERVEGGSPPRSMNVPACFVVRSRPRTPPLWIERRRFPAPSSSVGAGAESGFPLRRSSRSTRARRA